MFVRLQKFMADRAVSSRRAAEEIILEGRVKVNGRVVDTLGVKVDDEKDIVEVDGRIISDKDKKVYIMLHKPEGCVTTVKDEFNRRTVLDILKDVEERVFPVGRLDFDTSGLLLLTNDGELTYKLTHPKHNVEKTYIAKVVGEPTKEEMTRFEKGLYIDGRKTAPAKIFVVKKQGDFVSLKIVIKEGRNRQVRRMCEAIGHPVKNLKRIATGKLFLGELKKGEYRYLTDSEVKYLKEC